jgi:hypothetical protein
MPLMRSVTIRLSAHSINASTSNGGERTSAHADQTMPALIVYVNALLYPSLTIALT